MSEVEVLRQHSVDMSPADEIVQQEATSSIEPSEHTRLQLIICCSGTCFCKKPVSRNQVEDQPQGNVGNTRAEEETTGSTRSTESSEDDCFQPVICCQGSNKTLCNSLNAEQAEQAFRKKIWPIEGLRIKNRQPRKQILLALKVIGALRREEKNKAWDFIARAAPIAILITGIISTILSFVFNGLVNPGIDIPCTILTVIDVILLVCYDFEKVHKRFFFTTNGLEHFEHWQYYFDSLVAELLLYPATICSVISISTQRAWTTDFSDNSTVTHDDRLGVLDLIMASLDAVTLCYIYGDRVRVIYLLMKDLRKKFRTDEWFITHRIVFFIASNALLFLFMTIHLGLQIYYDNLPGGYQPCKVHADNKQMVQNLVGDNFVSSNFFSHNVSPDSESEDGDKICMPFLTGMMVLVTLSLPVVNLAAFLCLNYTAFLKLLVNFNYSVTNHKEKYEKDLRDSDEQLWKLVEKMAKETDRQHNAVNDLNSFQRLSLVTLEWWINFIIMTWVGLLAAYCMLFYRHYIEYVENAESLEAYAVVYMVLFLLSVVLIVLANFNGLFAAAAAPIMIIPALISDLRTKEVKSASRQKDQVPTPRPPTPRPSTPPTPWPPTPQPSTPPTPRPPTPQPPTPRPPTPRPSTPRPPTPRPSTPPTPRPPTPRPSTSPTPRPPTPQPPTPRPSTPRPSTPRPPTPRPSTPPTPRPPTPQPPTPRPSTPRPSTPRTPRPLTSRTPRTPRVRTPRPSTAPPYVAIYSAPVTIVDGSPQPISLRK